MPNSASNPSGATWNATTTASGGLLSAFIGGLLVAQAGGGDRELFLSLGFLLGAVGLLGIIIGGVATGIRMARD